MTSTKRRNKVLIALSIILLSIVIIALILFDILNTNLNCQLTDIKPDNHSRDVKNLVSDNLQAIVAFDGYLVYNKPNELFLGLNLESVYKTDQKDGTKSLALSMDCGQVELTLRVTKDHNFVDLILVHLTNGTSCYIENNEIFTTEADHHLECKHLELDCKSMKKFESNGIDSVITLYINKIEFEIDGDEDKYKSSDFSKPEQMCLSSRSSTNDHLISIR